VKFALLQMTAGIDPAANAATIVDAVAEAKAGGAAMLFTPEMSNLIDRDRERAAANIVGEAAEPVLAAVQAAAKAHGLWVSLGSLAVRQADGRFANRTFVIDAGGEVRARYDKLHLFDVNVGIGDR
jgi:predicted amidohydrolase